MRKRPDLIERNKSSRQRKFISDSWKNEEKRKTRIENIKRHMGPKKATYGHLGKPHTQEIKDRIRLLKIGKNTGPDHWNWKGGISTRQMNTFMYKSWRNDVFTRDNFTCQMPLCGIRGGDLEAHHILKWNDNPEKRFDVDNGLTLCKKCHNKTKGKEERYIALFMEILKIHNLASNFPKV